MVKWDQPRIQYPCRNRISPLHSARRRVDIVETFSNAPAVSSRSDRAGATGAVVEFNYETFAETAGRVDPHRGRKADELWCHQNLEVFVAHVAIRRQVFSLGIGVDRHLSNLASTNRCDVVDGHGATPLGEQLLGLGCDFDVHTEPSQ